MSAIAKCLELCLTKQNKQRNKNKTQGSFPSIGILSFPRLPVQAQRRSRDQSRSASALSISGGEEKSEHSEAADQRLSTYSDGGAFFSATSTGIRRLFQMGVVMHPSNPSIREAPTGGLQIWGQPVLHRLVSNTTTKTIKWMVLTVKRSVSSLVLDNV